jgi:hypothetical protein
MRPESYSGAERRLTQRQRVFKGGRLKFNKGYSVFECLVRNRSDTGALLALGTTCAIPARFELDVACEGAWKAVTVRWRTTAQLGVSFD